MITYMDRAANGSAKGLIARDLGFPEADYFYVLMAFPTRLRALRDSVRLAGRHQRPAFDAVAGGDLVVGLRGAHGVRGAVVLAVGFSRSALPG